MDSIINELISTVLQLAVFTLIPFLVYVIIKKKVGGFFRYVGFVKTTSKAIWLSLGTSFFFLAGALLLVVFSEDIRQIMLTPPSVTGKLREMGFGATSVITLFLIACLKTSLAEEILFRGFIAKRLTSWLGYRKGNFWQSLLFAAIHALLFWALTKAGWPFLLFIFFFSGIAAYLIGYIKEKVGKGSILPGWVAHGTGNLVSYWIIAFVI
ncbi:CPBP family intramembrane glutamic endopeptidase [Parapedobacter sp. DT-150]|uniref:CPBP family intramembrane glutamic endopeptidase n=1 Tax=Parapedobacter sp. DT-150 TaxID=3396162 RepID=UPI003F1991B0